MRHIIRNKQDKRIRQARDIFYIVFCTTILTAICYNTKIHTTKLISPLAVAQAESVSPTPTPTYTPPILAIYDSNKQPTQDEVESYIKRIFTDQADTAIAISHAECSPSNREYPACVLHTDAEYSVGIFQINLYNAQQNIHADRIPGTTREEKIEWLKNPFNNTLYAWWVYSTSGFNPWSTYQSGAYLK